MFKNIIILLSFTALAFGNSVQKSRKANNGLITRYLERGFDLVETESKQIHEPVYTSAVRLAAEYKRQGVSGTSSDETENLTTPETLTEEERLEAKAAEEEIKAWVNKLNCYKTSMGVLSCIMVKKISNEYYNDPERDPEMLKMGIQYLVSDLQKNSQVDSDLTLLIQKYAAFFGLNDV